MKKDNSQFWILVFLLVFVFFTAVQISKAQLLKKTEGEKVIDKPTNLSTLQFQPVPLDEVVNPELYYIGPSDGIAVNIWMSPPLSFLLTVTPEGTLIVPTVGEIAVANLTLAQAKQKIISETRKKYIAADITVTLVQPRPIVVHVTGNVLNEGLYTLTSIERANGAIEEANKLTTNKTKLELEQILKSASTRNIILKRNDGSIHHIDLVKFMATKDARWSPYLREGDIIVVPQRSLSKNVIGIYGEVNAPGRYEYVEGDSLLDLLKICHGFTSRANLDSIEFYRSNEDGTHYTITQFRYADLTTGRFPNLETQPGDRIFVRGKSEQREDYRVEIEGEVLYPGTYPITKNQTRLSEVIQRAGGFTEFAALKSALVIRQSIRPEELEMERMLSLRGGTAPEDTADYFLETELRLRKEIVGADFERLFIYGDQSQDVILQSEDSIIVPSVKQTIYVFGQVITPGHVPFVKNKVVSYYIQKAGGYTERARKGDVRIIKAKTKQWLDPDETIIEEGDYIWVPKEPEHPFSYYMTVASQAASVLSVVVGVVVIIIQVIK